ncbi:MAG: putative peptidoglycan glycosyltransferase FtsW [Pseudomonadota bacterium]
MSPFSRADNSIMARWWWTVDRWMLGTLLVLCVVGVLIVFAASPAVAEKIGAPTFHFFRKQVVFAFLGMATMFAFSFATPRTVWRFAIIAYPCVLVAIACCLVFAPVYNGSQRWLQFPGFTIQPSEFVKPCFAVVTAWLLASQQGGTVLHAGPKEPQNRTGIALMTATALLIITCAMLVKQPDFGQTALILGVWVLQLFLAGYPLYWFAVLSVLASAGAVAAFIHFDHVRGRILQFWDRENHESGQMDVATEGFRNGGLFGRGPNEGVAKLKLPEAQGDYIFAVLGEEFGAAACIILASVFAIILIRGFLRLLKETDLFVFLATAGLLASFGAQAVINMSVNLDMMPSKGMTLPFISYGGSSLLALSLSMGMVLALTRQNRYLLQSPRGYHGGSS